MMYSTPRGSPFKGNVGMLRANKDWHRENYGGRKRDGTQHLVAMAGSSQTIHLIKVAGLILASD